MRELKTPKDIENYIHDLEKQVFQLKNTHAFRLGMSVMSFYNKPHNLKILGMSKFLKELIASTKKTHLTQTFSSRTKVVLETNNVAKVEKQIKTQTDPIGLYYFLPFIKEKVNILTLSDVDNKPGYHLMTPNNMTELLGYGNFNEIHIETSSLLNISCWRNVGTYDEIFRTNKLLDLLKSNKNLRKVLIHQNDLILFPLLLDRLDVFDEVMTVGEFAK